MPKKHLVIILLILVGFFIFMHQKIQNSPPSEIKPYHNFSDLMVGDQKIKVEVVKTRESIALGLGKRKSLDITPIGQVNIKGMLFVFPTRRISTFWMKDMQFDIDIVWIDEGEVVQINRNVPRPLEGISDNELPLYSPQEPILMVLELEAGEAERLEIEVGDRVELVN